MCKRYEESGACDRVPTETTNSDDIYPALSLWTQSGSKMCFMICAVQSHHVRSLRHSGTLCVHRVYVV